MIAALDKLKDIVHEYDAMTEDLERVLAVAGAYGSGNTPKEHIDKYRDVGGTVSGEFAEIYDYFIEDLPDILDEAIELVYDPEIPVVRNPNNWKAYIEKRLEHFKSKILPNLARNLEEGGVRDTRREFNIANMHMANLWTFIKVAEEAIEDPSQYPEVYYED